MASFTESGFRGDYFFLSNFYEQPLWIGRLGMMAPTGEHAYNALKTVDTATREAILKATTPGQAKGLGRKAPLREGWEAGGRVAAMSMVISAKFSLPFRPILPNLAAMLIDTDSTMLIEINDWHDNFWGSCLCTRRTCGGKGINMLGELLMARRTILQHPKDF
jgi:hypothetical protein